MKRRLFLFAAYDGGNVAGPSLLWYVRALAEYGDVVIVADNDFSEEDLKVLESVAVHCEAARHGEYDFGSYKRAYSWAVENLQMDSYNYLYLVNDSVFGPLSDISVPLMSMEALGTEAFSLVMNPGSGHPHLQSWFIGMEKSVFLSDWFRDFLYSVTVQADKVLVCELYENGLTRLFRAKGISTDALMRVRGKGIYNSVKRLWLAGLPFIKKSSFTRHEGCLGAQVKYVLERVSPECRAAILADAERLYGRDYMETFLTGNPLVPAWRYCRYLYRKLIRSGNA